MNSCDEAYRNKKDIAELLGLMPLVKQWYSFLAGEGMSYPEDREAIAKLDALIARRADEDAGGVVG